MGAPLRKRCVDLLVRTFHQDAHMLLLLLKSVELFWPLHAWGVVVVLDDSAEDRAMASRLPRWVEVHFEGFPTHQWWSPAVSRGHARHGFALSMWSLFFADAYTRAKYVAITDADSLLVAPAMPSLLFAHATDDDLCVLQRPVLAGFASETVFWGFAPAVAALDLEWKAEFMASHPSMYLRHHIARGRKLISSRVSVAAQYDPALNFTEAFGVLTHMANRAMMMWGGEEQSPHSIPCFQSIMGHLAWNQDWDYHYSISYPDASDGGAPRSADLPDRRMLRSDGENQPDMYGCAWPALFAHAQDLNAGRFQPKNYTRWSLNLLVVALCEIETGGPCGGGAATSWSEVIMQRGAPAHFAFRPDSGCRASRRSALAALDSTRKAASAARAWPQAAFWRMEADRLRMILSRGGTIRFSADHGPATE